MIIAAGIFYFHSLLRRAIVFKVKLEWSIPIYLLVIFLQVNNKCVSVLKKYFFIP